MGGFIHENDPQPSLLSGLWQGVIRSSCHTSTSAVVPGDSPCQADIPRLDRVEQVLAKSGALLPELVGRVLVILPA